MEPLILLGALLTAHTVTFPEALADAEHAPAIEAAHAAHTARATRAQDVSSFTYNPTLQVQPGVRTPDGGGLLPEVYLSASQRFNASGLSDARRVSLQRESEDDARAIDVARLQARAAVAHAWIARWMGQTAYALAQQEVALVDQAVVSMEATAQAGEATRVDVEQLRAFRAEVLLNALRLEAEAFDAGLALTRAVGATRAQPTGVDGPLPEVGTVALHALQQRVHDVQHVPEVAAARATHATRQAHLTETTAARGSTYALGAMAFREGSGDIAVLATLDVDLPLFEAGQRERAAVAAEVALADGRARQAEIDARVMLAEALHALEHTQQVLHVTEQELVASALALADAQHQRWLAREATTYEWTQARRQVLLAKIAQVRIQAEVARAAFDVAERFARAQTPRSR